MWHDSFTCETWQIHVCVMNHSCVIWLIHMCDMTHSYVTLQYLDVFSCNVFLESFTCVTWHIHVCRMAHPYVWHDSLLCNDEKPWESLHDTCDMTHSYVWHDKSMCVYWRIHVYDMTHVLCIAKARKHSTNCVTWLIHMCNLTEFICVPWRIHMSHIKTSELFYAVCDMAHFRTCDMTHSYVWLDSFICVTCLIYANNAKFQSSSIGFTTWLSRMYDMTHSYVCNDSFMNVTWLIHVWQHTICRAFHEMSNWIQNYKEIQLYRNIKIWRYLYRFQCIPATW